jgi:hypothetical protein
MLLTDQAVSTSMNGKESVEMVEGASVKVMEHSRRQRRCLPLVVQNRTLTLLGGKDNRFG